MRHIFISFLFVLVITKVIAQIPKLETVIQKGHSAALKTVAISPDGKFLATGSRDKSVKLWDYQSGLEIRSLIGHDHTVNGLSFSPNGLYLASSSADGTARIWDVLTGKEVFISPKSSEYVTSVSFSPDSKLIAFGGYSDSAYICAIPLRKIN